MHGIKSTAVLLSTAERGLCMEKKWLLRFLSSLGITAAAGFVLFYFMLPPLSFYSAGFYGYLIFLCVIYSAAQFVLFSWKQKGRRRASSRMTRKDFYTAVAGIAAAGLLFLVLVLGRIIFSPLFFAKRYASVITVKEAVFEEDMPEATSVTNIALMDTESAKIIGNRTLGALSELVSQYSINETYTQINYQNAPQKLANLEYDDFFKWLNNRSKGVPGYVMVDPVNNSASYQKLEKPLRYVQSGYFGDNLERKLRFSYPTKIFDTYYFEIDEEGNPYYIVPCLRPQIGLFGAMDVAEVILFNPCDGSSKLYPIGEVPAWVDIVYNGDLASEKYNWYGKLSGGFWNSVIGNKNCKMTTDDYGYIVLGDDVWYFTGVTSVTADESNIGFLITNARTGEYKFYPVVGAEEYSAMGAAEGEVQEKGYKASFPSLVNISGQATYIMVLKDSGGLVKLYALVNVENYGIVATAETQGEAIAAYKKLLRANEMGAQEDGMDGVTAEILVEDVRIVTVDEVPIVYVTDSEGDVYKGYLKSDESLILIRRGDRLRVSASQTENERIYFLEKWEFIGE